MCRGSMCALEQLASAVEKLKNYELAIVEYK